MQISAIQTTMVRRGNRVFWPLQRKEDFTETLGRKIYVDYENVQSAGLNGIEELLEKDSVILFYSSHADTMKIEVVEKLMHIPQKIKFIKVETGTPNALDFQLISCLFMDPGREERYIISKDTGYDAVFHLGKNGGYHMKRLPSIDGIFSPDFFEKEETSEIEKQCGKEITEKYGPLILDGLKESSNRGQFDRFFRKNLGEEEGRNLYGKIKDCFEELKRIV